MGREKRQQKRKIEEREEGWMRKERKKRRKKRRIRIEIKKKRSLGDFGKYCGEKSEVKKKNKESSERITNGNEGREISMNSLERDKQEGER